MPRDIILIHYEEDNLYKLDDKVGEVNVRCIQCNARWYSGTPSWVIQVKEKEEKLKKLDELMGDNQIVDYSSKIAEAKKNLTNVANLKGNFPDQKDSDIWEQYATIITAFHAEIEHRNKNINHTEAGFK